MALTKQPNFTEAQDKASELLSKQGKFDTLSIDVFKLAFDYNILFDSMQNYCKLTDRSFKEFGFDKLNNGGVIILGNDTFLILYNEKHSPERINWTLAHEVGHIYLGHQTDGAIEEVEAHFFAAQLLMPEVVLRLLEHELHEMSAEFIYQNFYVSYEASSKRVATLNKKSVTLAQYDKVILNIFEKAIYYVKDLWPNPTNELAGYY